MLASSPSEDYIRRTSRRPASKAMSDSDSDVAMSESRRAERHERWLTGARTSFQRVLHYQVQRRYLIFSRKVVMLLTLEPLLLESLRRTLQALPSGTIDELYVNMRPWLDDQYCRNPPSQEAMEATARQLVHIVNRYTSLSALSLHNDAPLSITSFCLTMFSQLQRLCLESCSLTTATVRSIFSITTLKQLEMRHLAFPTSESITAFCRGMSTSSLQEVSMESVVIPPEHKVQLATTLARCNTLLQFICKQGTSSALFYDQYCVELLNNHVDSQLEWLH